MPNLRYTARGRPQSMHRRTSRVENFGGRFAAAILDLLAMDPLLSSLVVGSVLGIRRYAAASPSPSFLSGSPIATRNSRASSSDVAEVTKVIFMP